MRLLSPFLLLLLTFNSFAATVDTFEVFSTVMNKQIKNIVIKPSSYAAEELTFPTVYLLHGAFGNHKDWLTKVPALLAYADQHEMIIVCPDGGFNTWYFDSPIDPSMQYETYVAKELVEAVDSQYRTQPLKGKRAITGLSMGGHGALYLCFRHQDTFGAAGSMSGGVDLRPFPDNWNIKDRIGTYAAHPERWENNSVTNLLYLLNGETPPMIIDCGVDDFFYQVNARLHDKMVERNIAHDYIERPGQHNWDYWTNAVQYQLVFFNNFFQVKE
ncbi:MAG: esterase family protein [Saprospiraceae bacterium]|nr:esterase family protein [Saprospiraceae bacterium]